jgi:hypothetical protein
MDSTSNLRKKLPPYELALIIFHKHNSIYFLFVGMWTKFEDMSYYLWAPNVHPDDHRVKMLNSNYSGVQSYLYEAAAG